MALRILVADDHPAIFMAIRGLLQKQLGWEICAEAATGGAMLHAVPACRPDVVVTDYHMPGDRTRDGIHMIESLRRHYPAVKVVVLTMITNPLILRAILRVPVHGLCLKSAPLNELVSAISHVQRGLTYVGPAVTQILEENGGQNPYRSDRDSTQLSVREAEVLRHYLSGKSVTQIAGVLNRSVKTISRQKNCAMQKLGANNDRELFDYVARQDLLPPSTSSS